MVLVVEFVERKAREGLLKGSPSICYISDSALDFAVRFEISVLPDFVSFAVVNVPQHHYIFDEAVSWCVVVSSEGYVDFGIPLKP